MFLRDPVIFLVFKRVIDLMDCIFYIQNLFIIFKIVEQSHKIIVIKIIYKFIEKFKHNQNNIRFMIFFFYPLSYFLFFFLQGIIA